MFPNGIGLMFHNCVDTLGYYASRTGTLLVNNAGIITAIAVGRYGFPRATAVAFGGVIASQGASWLAREIDARYHVHIADIHNWIRDQLPASVRAAYPNVVRNLAIPSRAVANYAGDQTRVFQFINESFLSEAFAPVYEELAYRYVGQELLSRMLMAAGVPGLAATGIAMSLSNTLFALSHDQHPQSPHFRETVVVGTVFGAMMHFHGLPAAMLTHSYHNAVIRLRESLD